MPNETGSKLVNLEDLREAFNDAKKIATPSTAGLLSAVDKTKLDGIAAGAQVTSVNNQTGAVSITPSNIGAFDLGLHYTDIPSGANLDNYTTPGNYVIKNGVKPNEISGKPMEGGNAFHVRVIYPLNGTWYKGQYYTDYADGHTWYRLWNNSWSSWTQLF